MYHQKEYTSKKKKDSFGKKKDSTGQSRIVVWRKNVGLQGWKRITVHQLLLIFFLTNSPEIKVAIIVSCYFVS